MNRRGKYIHTIILKIKFSSTKNLIIYNLFFKINLIEIKMHLDITEPADFLLN